MGEHVTIDIAGSSILIKKQLTITKQKKEKSHRHKGKDIYYFYVIACWYKSQISFKEVFDKYTEICSKIIRIIKELRTR
ncbi:MAG: hypothetical protein ABIC04_03915 [Nanoarchaeota archaeon]